MEHEDLGYQPFLDDLESINEEFLLRNYTTVWLGCIDLLVKLLRLPSPQTTPQPSSPADTSDDSFEKNMLETPKSSDSLPITLIEKWKQLYSPPFKIMEDRHRSLFHLWINIWSLLITVVGKETAVETTLTKSNSSLLGHPFSQSDITTMETQLYGMERSLNGIWAALVPFYAPDIHTIPSDLVLGLMLVAIKHQSFSFAESVAVYWTENLPDSWCAQLKECTRTLKWDEIEDDSATDGIERLCQHYDSIQTLYITHALVGQARWASIPGVIRKDKILSTERQLHLSDLVDQAFQEYESSQITLDQPPQSAAALASKSPAPRPNTLVTKSPDFLSRFKVWSRKIFGSKNVTPIVVSGVAALIIALWLTKRNSLNNKRWGMLWLLRIVRSIRPALPPTS